MRTGDYQNAEYDRRLAEFKALKAQMKQEKQVQQGQGQAKPTQQSSNSSSVVKRY